MGLSVLFKEERLFSLSDIPFARKYIASFLSKYARKSVLIVSGEFSPKTYEAPNFISAVRNFASRGAILEVIAGKSKEKLLRENSTILRMAKEREGKIKVYLCKERPVYHFIVCDEKTLLIQGVHPPGEPAEMYFVEDEPKIAREYVEKFWRLAGGCPEVIVEGV